MQSGPTAHQHLKFWAGSQELREQRSCRCNLLEVIQHQQEVLLAKGAFELIEHRLPGAFSQTQGIGDGGSNECGVAKSLQQDEADTSGKVLPQVGAIWSASRVLPMPPGPVRTRRRTCARRSSALTVATSGFGGQSMV